MAVTRKITLKNEQIEYGVRKHRRAKRLKIAISCDGNCMVTLPWRMGLWNAEKFLRQNSAWVLDKMKAMKKKGRQSLFSRGNRQEYLRLKEYAREFVIRRLEKYKEIYGFGYRGIYIRNQKTRWGSCSSKKNLNFNYKIIFLPESHADYVIIHELCHLQEFNHSKQFWNLVAQTVPEYKEIKKQLKVL
jgi:predicted metal-dependent hydrolase